MDREALEESQVVPEQERALEEEANSTPFRLGYG